MPSRVQRGPPAVGVPQTSASRSIKEGFASWGVELSDALLDTVRYRLMVKRPTPRVREGKKKPMYSATAHSIPQGALGKRGGGGGSAVLPRSGGPGDRAEEMACDEGLLGLTEGAGTRGLPPAHPRLRGRNGLRQQKRDPERAKHWTLTVLHPDEPVLSEHPSGHLAELSNGIRALADQQLLLDTLTGAPIECR